MESIRTQIITLIHIEEVSALRISRDRRIISESLISGKSLSDILSDILLILIKRNIQEPIQDPSKEYIEKFSCCEISTLNSLLQTTKTFVLGQEKVMNDIASVMKMDSSEELKIKKITNLVI